jgi:hypothetical protein
MSEIPVLDLPSRISKNTAQRIVEKDKISLDICFEKSVGHVLNEDAVAIMGYVAGFQQGGIIQALGILGQFIAHMAKSFFSAYT